MLLHRGQRRIPDGWRVDPELVGEADSCPFCYLCDLRREALLGKLQVAACVISGRRGHFLLSSQSHRMCADEAQLRELLGEEVEEARGDGGVLDPLPPLEASLVDVRQKQGRARVGAGVPSGPARMLAPFFPLLFLLLPPILSSSSSLISSLPSPPPSPFSPSSFSFNKKLL